MKTINPKTFFKKLISDDVTSPFIIAEKKIFINVPTTEQEKAIYERLYNDLYVFLSKVPKSPASNVVKKILDRQLLYLGRNIESSKVSVLGRALITSELKFAGVIVDVGEFGINIETGETENIDQIFYTIYYFFIIGIGTIYFTEIKKRVKIILYLSKYLQFLLLRFLGSNVFLDESQKKLLDYICLYYIIRFQLNYDHDTSKLFVKQYLKSDNDMKILDKIKNYDKMTDIFKSLIDFNIVSENLNILIMRALSKFKPFGFFNITSELKNLLACSICSLYPISLLTNMQVSRELQSKIEDEIMPFIDAVKFDTRLVNLIYKKNM